MLARPATLAEIARLQATLALLLQPHHVAAETPIEPAPKGGTWHALDHCPELPKES